MNKTSTRVTLRWDVGASEVLSETQRRRIRTRLASRMTLAGELVVHAQVHRTQRRNRELARDRMAELLREAMQTKRRRVATKPSRSSRERTLETKKRRSSLKRGRVKPSADE